jgi:ATP/ADP translocase
MNKNVPHILGFWSAIIAVILVFTYGLLQVLTDNNVIPAIDKSILLFLPPLLLAPVFLLVVVSLHYSVGRENKIWTSIALSIATVYCGQINAICHAVCNAF